MGSISRVSREPDEDISSWVLVDPSEEAIPPEERISRTASPLFSEAYGRALLSAWNFNRRINHYSLIHNQLPISAVISTIQMLFWLPLFELALFRTYLNFSEKLCSLSTEHAKANPSKIERAKENLRYVIRKLKPSLSQHAKEMMWNRYFSSMQQENLSFEENIDLFQKVQNAILTYQNKPLEKQFLLDWQRSAGFVVMDHFNKAIFHLHKEGVNALEESVFQTTPFYDPEEYEVAEHTIFSSQAQDNEFGKELLCRMNPQNEEIVHDLLCLACSQSINAAHIVFFPQLNVTRWASTNSLLWDINDRGFCELHIHRNERGEFSYANVYLRTIQRLKINMEEQLYEVGQAPRLAEAAIESNMQFHKNIFRVNLQELSPEERQRHILKGYAYTLTSFNYHIYWQ